MKESLSKGEFTFKPPEGIDRKYLHVKEIREPIFRRDINKTEAGVVIQADGLFEYAGQRINRQIQK